MMATMGLPYPHLTKRDCFIEDTFESCVCELITDRCLTLRGNALTSENVTIKSCASTGPKYFPITENDVSFGICVGNGFNYIALS